MVAHQALSTSKGSIEFLATELFRQKDRKIYIFNRDETDSYLGAAILKFFFMAKGYDVKKVLIEAPEEGKTEFEKVKEMVGSNSELNGDCYYFAVGIFPEDIKKEAGFMGSNGLYSIGTELEGYGLSKFTSNVFYFRKRDKDAVLDPHLCEYVVYVYLMLEDERANDIRKIESIDTEDLDEKFQEFANEVKNMRDNGEKYNNLRQIVEEVEKKGLKEKFGL